jgi:hypothetical protein
MTMPAIPPGEIPAEEEEPLSPGVDVDAKLEAEAGEDAPGAVELAETAFACTTTPGLEISSSGVVSPAGRNWNL